MKAVVFLVSIVLASVSTILAPLRAVLLPGQRSTRLSRQTTPDRPGDKPPRPKSRSRDRSFLNRAYGAVVVLGSACWDDKYRYERSKTNKHTVVELDDFARSYGGAGANVSLALRKLNDDVRLILAGNVGDDRDGRDLRRMMNRHGVKMPLPPIAGERTSVSFCFTDVATNQAQIYTIPGARIKPIPLRFIERQLRGAKAVVVTAPTVNEQISDYLEIARRQSLPVYFGLGSRQIFGMTMDELAQTIGTNPVELVICNNHEAEHLVGSKDSGRQLEALTFGGKVRIAVVTAGENGLYALADGQRYDIPADSTAVRWRSILIR